MTKAKRKPTRTVGQCVYCGTLKGPLTEEHILAANLGGDETLLQACCEPCQKEINENVEQPFLRRMYRDIRYRRGIGTRRVKHRPRTLEAYIRPDDLGASNQPFQDPKMNPSGWTLKHLPYAEHPTFLTLPLFPSPGLLRGIPSDRSIEAGPVTYWTYQERVELNRQIPQILCVSTEFNAFVFIRLLAKTAHCFAVSEFGLEGFQPYLTRIILGKQDLNACWHYIGGAEPEQPVNEAATMRLGVISSGFLVNWIIVDIRLFADLGAPTYRVFAGKKVAK